MSRTFFSTVFLLLIVFTLYAHDNRDQSILFNSNDKYVNNNLFVELTSYENVFSFNSIEKDKGVVKVSNAPLHIYKETVTAEGDKFVAYFAALCSSIDNAKTCSVFIKQVPSEKLDKIHVFLKDEKVYEFYVLPRDAYLYAAAQETIKRLQGHHSI